MNVLWVILWISTLGVAVNGETSLPNTGEQDQGGMFSIVTPGRVQQMIPIIDSCPNSFQITPLVAMSDYKGPAPAGPYTLILLTREQIVDGAGQPYERLYSKTIDLGNLGTPFSINPPWRAGTQFIACFWSSNKITAGCQDLYTVTNTTNSENAFANTESECMVPSVLESWVPTGDAALDVDVDDEHGLLANNGWPTVCTDIRFTPKSGVPPYTLVIAPAFHPPVNITSNSSVADHAMNYTVRFTHGQAFFAAVYDSAGASFAIGPLHAGKSANVTCLQTLTGVSPPKLAKSSSGLSVAALAGSAIGAFVVGALLAALITRWLTARGLKKRNRGVSTIFSPLRTREEDADLFPSVAPYRQPSTFTTKADRITSGPVSLYEASDVNELSYAESRGRPLSGDTGETYRRSMGLSEFGGLHNPHGEQLREQTSQNHSSSAQGRKSDNHFGSSTAASNDSHGAQGGSTGHAGPSRNVYVVHSDAGPGNLTIQLPEGSSNVVELPPQYRNGEGDLVREQDDSMPIPYFDSPPLPRKDRGSYSPEAMARAQAQMAEKRRRPMPE